ALTGHGTAKLQSIQSFVIQQLTGDVTSPGAGSLSNVDDLNNRSFVEVTFTVPSYAAAIDVASVTDLAPEFTISPTNTADGTVALDATQAPVLVSHTGSSHVFRYFTTGTHRTGAVTITWLPGSFGYLDAAGNAIPLFLATQQATVHTTPSDKWVE